MKKKYSKKRYLKRILIVMLLFIIAICVMPRIIDYARKNRIFKMVTENKELLNQSVSTGAYDEANKIKGVKDISVYTTNKGKPLIDYFCDGFGIAPSSIYYGFYYVSDNVPTGFQGSDINLIKKGKGWVWSEVSGDNWYYTEKIIDNWYYYEAGF